MIRNRHGINVYGTNTEQRSLRLGPAHRGDVIEATFAFNCWLARGEFSVSLAVHSRDGVSYDWLDGVLFFQVTSPALIEGVANLNASATARHLGMQIADCGLRNEDRGDGTNDETKSAIRNPQSEINESLTHG